MPCGPLILQGWAEALPHVGMVIGVMVLFDALCLYGGACLPTGDQVDARHCGGSMFVNESQIRALIRLLGDGMNASSRRSAESRIDYGDSAAAPAGSGDRAAGDGRPDRHCVGGDPRHEAGGRLRDLSAVLPDEQVDLERGAFLLARYTYPSLDVQAYQRQLDLHGAGCPGSRSARGCRVRDRQGAQPVPTCSPRPGFKGNTKNYYEVENSYLNLCHRPANGHSISLSTVYLLIGRRLQLSCPWHRDARPLLVKFDSDRYKIFIDCFNGGALTEKNCARFLTEAGYGFEDRFLQKSPTRPSLPG